jgi:hypothetical protein
MAVRAEKHQELPRTLPPGTEVDGWRILQLLGETHRGTSTYLVESVAQPGEWFVLKLGRELEDERVGRELGLLMARVSHPHVARLRACGRWPDPINGQFYVVMDWVDGLPLHTWATTCNPSIGSVVDKLAAVAVTLEHLHAEGILHRDLKPEHIVVREPDGKPILIDFGVWRCGRGDNSPWRERVQGTPHLFSPEAMAFWRKHAKVGARYDAKPTDDVYALGVSAYRVLTGQWPVPPHLAQRNLFEVLERTPPRPLEQLNPRLPRALCEVVQRMMAKQARDRFQSCAEAHAALVTVVSVAGPEELESSLRASEPGPERPPVAAPLVARRPGWSLWRKELAGAMGLGWFIAMAAVYTHAPRGEEKAAELEGPRAALAADGTPCSQKASRNMRLYQIGTLRLRPREHAAQKGSLVIDVRDDEQAVWAMQDPWASRVPVGTLFHGRIWVRDRLYGRFDRLSFPDGKQVAVCMEFWKSEAASGSAGQDGGLRFVPGIALAEPSSQAGTGRVDIQEIEVDVVKRWGALK